MLRNLLNELRQAEGEYSTWVEGLRERVSTGGEALSAEEKAKQAEWSAELTEKREQFRTFAEMAETERENGEIGELRDILSTDAPEVMPTAEESWRASETEVDAIRALGTPNARKVELNLLARHNEKVLIRMGITGRDLAEAAKRGWLMRYDPDEQIKRGRGNAVRAYNIGTDSAGGYTVPTITSTSLYDYMEYIGGLGSAGSEVIMTEGMEQIELPLVQTHAEGTAKDGTGDIGATDKVWDSFVLSGDQVSGKGNVPTKESKAAPKLQDTLSQVVLDAYRFDGYSVMTEEMRRSNIVGFADYLGKSLGRALAKKKEYAFHFGSGTNEPQGVLATLLDDAASNSRSIATHTMEHHDHLLPKDFTGAFALLDPAYTIQDMALRIMMHSGIMWRMAGQQNAEVYANADANLTFQSSLLNVPNRRLYGNPIDISAYMTTDLPSAKPAKGGNVLVALIGCFMDGYVIRNAGTIELAASDDVRFLTSETVIRARCWADGEVRDPRCFVKLQTPAAG